MVHVQERADEDGQSLLELLFAIGVAFSLFSIGGALLWRSWKVAGCLYHAFESTHHSLTGGPRHASPFPVSYERRSGVLTGTLQCGTTEEKVSLPELEAALWD
ncbi:MAG: hypothetical protein HYX41_01735 [Bdellovibrio sp.]|nr:hypothetical protein [Bdellovibrio sp.]